MCPVLAKIYEPSCGSECSSFMKTERCSHSSRVTLEQHFKGEAAEVAPSSEVFPTQAPQNPKKLTQHPHKIPKTCQQTQPYSHVTNQPPKKKQFNQNTPPPIQSPPST